MSEAAGAKAADLVAKLDALMAEEQPDVGALLQGVEALKAPSTAASSASTTSSRVIRSGARARR